MNNFYKKNKFNRLLSLILMVCLIVTSVLPTNVLAEPSNSNGSPGGFTSSNGPGSGPTTQIGNGGYRFTLLFLQGDIPNEGNILDRAGNVNIDLWREYQEYIECLGTLDVYYYGHDHPNNTYFNGSAFDFDFTRNKKRENEIKATGRKMAAADGDELKLSKFSWQIYNTNTGPVSSASTPNQTQIGPVLATKLDEEISLDLYPPGTSNPSTEEALISNKYELTEDCAKILKVLCDKNGITNYVKSSKYEETSANDNVFEEGIYNGKTGSYRLLIEPYEVIGTNGSGTVMTLRDAYWFENQQSGKLTASNSHLWNLGNYLAKLVNVNYMPAKDIFGLNGQGVILILV